MNILLMTLNSKYAHSSLALRYLEAAGKEKIDELEHIEKIDIKEYTINNELDKITGDIFRNQYDIVIASVYIWNLEETNIVLGNLKKVAPHIEVFYGGPEVSYNAQEILQESPFVRGILRGEGEETFCELLEVINKAIQETVRIDKILTKSQVLNMTHRSEEKIIQQPIRPYIKNLDVVPFPYRTLDDLKHRKIYYESSRGCPFNCSYCLSSVDKQVRYFSLERVKRDLHFFIKNRVEQVKFVDRTFNLDKNRTLEIFQYLIENDNHYTNFHFEMTASLLDDDYISVIKEARPGLFQFEIGVQSTFEKTTIEIDRNVNLDSLKHYVNELMKLNNSHIHLDLIAGLPYESFERFKKSFDEVYNLKPHQLQLGFLKVLKGTKMHNNCDQYGIVYAEQQPYEVLKTKDISYEELLLLKDVEDVVEKIYNSTMMANSLEKVIGEFNSPFNFYFDFSKFLRKKGFFGSPKKTEVYYAMLLEFYEESNFSDVETFKETLKIDYFLKNKKAKDYLGNVDEKSVKNQANEYLKSEEWIEEYLPQYKGQLLKDMHKNIEVHKHPKDIIVKSYPERGYDKILTEFVLVFYNYGNKNPINSLPDIVVMPLQNG